MLWIKKKDAVAHIDTYGFGVLANDTDIEEASMEPCNARGYISALKNLKATLIQ